MKGEQDLAVLLGLAGQHAVVHRVGLIGVFVGAELRQSLVIVRIYFKGADKIRSLNAAGKTPSVAWLDWGGLVGQRDETHRRLRVFKLRTL